jgi:hypothetical protein
MKKILSFVILLAMLTCTATAGALTPFSDFHDGLWKGKMVVETTRADGAVEPHSWELIIAACKGKVSIWGTNPDGGFEEHNSDVTVQSKPDSYLLHFSQASQTQPGWVEIHAYTFFRLDTERAVVGWTRTVNNRGASASDKNRYYFVQGMGHFKLSTSDCSTGPN